MAKRWYVVHAYSGFEKNVARALKERIGLSKLEEYFGQVLVPTEEVVEMRAGQKRRSERKFFPGYVLVEMELNDETWHLVKETPRVMGFIGGKADRPAPLTENEAKAILDRVESGGDKATPKTIYEPGELKVIAYKNSKKWAEDTVRTTGDPSQISMSADRSSIKADGYDLSFVTVKIADRNGLMVPRTHNRLSVQISGPGVIAGIDNGDPTDHDSFRSISRRAFNGLALVIVRSKKGERGMIRISVAADGLKSGQISIASR